MSRLSRTLTLVLIVMASSNCPSVSQQPERDSSAANAEAPAEQAVQPARSSHPTPPPGRVFRAQVAAPDGQGFYTNDADALRRQLQGFLDHATPSSELDGRDLVGLMSPHAGYQYSGPTAAAAYRLLRGRTYRTVVVMALSHRQRADKVALLDHDAYQTPLGAVPIDTELVRQLVADDGELMEVNERVFRGEHSLEIQLPLLQLALAEGYRIVPIIIATGNESHAERLAQRLYQRLGRRRDVLYLASSDLSHFYPDQQARRIDGEILSMVTGMDMAEFRRRGPMGREMPCGYFPVLTLMELFSRYDGSARRTTLLQYENSGDTAGDRSRVVGYGAVAFSLNQGTRTETEPAPEPVPPAEGEAGGESPGIPYSRDERRALIDLAKRAVAAAVRGERFEPSRPDSELLRRNGAAFVTLSCQTKGRGRCVGRGDDLRGCVGHVIAQIPLYQCVAEMAQSAAIHDRRFPTVTEAELEHLSYEISVLTAPEPVHDPSSIVVGRDGLIMSRGMNRGLLLPQVPGEWGWDRDQFLARTCQKAGMEPTCWQDPATTIERFGAIVWGEDLDARNRH